MTRRIIWNRSKYQARPEPVTALNKHEKLKNRPLTDQERELIKKEFIKLNGIFPPNSKDSTRIKDLINETRTEHFKISVFQVSGYVVALHRQAHEGLIELRDRQEYLRNSRNHHKHFLTYKSKKYEEMRKQEGFKLVEGKLMTLKPKFAVPPQRIKVTKARHKVR